MRTLNELCFNIFCLSGKVQIQTGWIRLTLECNLRLRYTTCTFDSFTRKSLHIFSLHLLKKHCFTAEMFSALNKYRNTMSRSQRVQVYRKSLSLIIEGSIRTLSKLLAPLTYAALIKDQHSIRTTFWIEHNTAIRWNGDFSSHLWNVPKI